MKLFLSIVAAYLAIGLLISLISKVIWNYLMKNKKYKKDMVQGLREEYIRDGMSYSMADRAVESNVEDFNAELSYIRLTVIFLWLPDLIFTIRRLLIKNREK